MNRRDTGTKIGMKIVLPFPIQGRKGPKIIEIRFTFIYKRQDENFLLNGKRTLSKSKESQHRGQSAEVHCLSKNADECLSTQHGSVPLLKGLLDDIQSLYDMI